MDRKIDQIHNFTSSTLEFINLQLILKDNLWKEIISSIKVKKLKKERFDVKNCEYAYDVTTYKLF